MARGKAIKKVGTTKTKTTVVVPTTSEPETTAVVPAKVRCFTDITPQHVEVVSSFLTILSLESLTVEIDRAVSDRNEILENAKALSIPMVK